MKMFLSIVVFFSVHKIPLLNITLTFYTVYRNKADLSCQLEVYDVGTMQRRNIVFYWLFI